MTALLICIGVVVYLGIGLGIGTVVFDPHPERHGGEVGALMVLWPVIGTAVAVGAVFRVVGKVMK